MNPYRTAVRVQDNPEARISPTMILWVAVAAYALGTIGSIFKIPVLPFLSIAGGVLMIYAVFRNEKDVD